MKRLLLLIALGCALNAAAEPWRPTERWRGFNLLEMFNGRYEPFKEDDFRWMKEWGFNFVRLPMDYRGWIKNGDWEQLDEARLAWIDDAVRLGQKYGIHVQVCFHRAPGYTVAQPPEPRNLFTDPEALRVCALHWGAFAKRYKAVPPKDLSFNLFNEPANVEDDAYLKVATELVRVIRAENPDRMVMADGVSWGSKPAKSLIPLGVAQATRGYTPMSISHYKASWINPPPTATPTWPPTPAVTPLYGEHKAPWNIPLVIDGPMRGTLAIRPGRVSGKVTLRIEADGKTVADHVLDPKVGADGWENAEHKPEWNMTQADCTSTLTTPLPANVRRLQISIAQGDWAALRDLTLTDGAKAATLTFENQWGKTNPPLRFAGFDAKAPFQPATGALTGADFLQRETLAPWQEVVDAGIFVMVGEFGAHSHTPHDVTLAWLEDNLALWKKQGWGWALWNFRGSFGIMDSNRQDVDYETFNGRKLDRKMLELLRRY
ncbi:MAG: cellulase family glycosylhydrolase [Kiritimatiellaeota bacterium]|nr:cellulase family glycosylhydrolase [Kiritimatiellota bacterium]